MIEITSNDIRENLMPYMGEYESFLDCAPDIYDILCMLLKCNISKEERQKVVGAITSFIVPTNILPEKIYGPYNYATNIIIGVTVLSEININTRHTILSDKEWTRLLNAYSNSREIINKDEKQELLKFYGIRGENKRLADLFE